MRPAQALTVYQETEGTGVTNHFINVTDVMIPESYGPNEIAILENLRAQQLYRIHENCTQVSVAILTIDNGILDTDDDEGKGTE